MPSTIAASELMDKTCWGRWEELVEDSVKNCKSESSALHRRRRRRKCR